jgi:hypothetical protein
MAPGIQHPPHGTGKWLLLEAWLFLSATAEAFVITPTSSNTFYGDFNISPAMTAAYTSFKITNDTGAPATDLWVSIGGFSGGVLGLAPLEDGAFQLGDLAAGASGTAYFYLNASGASASPQGYSVCVHSGPPPSAPLYCTDLSFNSVEDTIRAGNSSVDGVILSIAVDPNPPTLGGTFSMTVEGRTGTLGVAEVLAFSPASTPDWPADCYELYSTEISLQSPNEGTLHDWLYVPPPLTSTVATNYTAVYSFRVVCAPTAAVEVLPATYVSSGNVVKHADVSALGVTIYPPVPAPSPTPTLTATRTATATRSSSPTATFSSTRTVTASGTQTATATKSSTATFSSTVTDVFTDTDTPTSSPSASSTSTSTVSPSATHTATPTQTSTATETATPTWTFSNTATATPTATVTATSTATETSTVTPSSSATATASVSPTQTATSTASPSVTMSSTATATPSRTPSSTNSPTSTISPTFTDSPTPPPPSVNITLKVYNAAGELVAVLAQGLNIPASFSGLGSPSEALIPELGGSNAALSLLGTGLDLTWDGKNSSGQRVDSGSYSAVAEVTDQFGKVTTYSTGFTVLRLVAELKVSVYNSAGELVYQVIKPTTALAELAELSFSTDKLLLGDGQPKLEVRYQRGSDPISWDGHNSQGRLVSAGMYMVKVEVTQAGLAPVIISKQVQVLRSLSADPLAGAFAAPNPARRGDSKVLLFLGEIDPELRVTAQFFDLAGERLGGGDNVGHPGSIDWELGAAAPGVYFAVLEAQADAGLQRKVIKLAVER